MAEFVFTSPGVKFRERDLSFVTRNVGVTTLGVVGETLRGPAFEPVYVQDQTQFAQRFGAQSIQRFPVNGQLEYQLPYVANAYLNESNQMWVTRVLGLSGYDAGNEWAVTLSAGVDPDTIGVNGTPTVQASVPFSGGSYLGVSIYATGQTGVSFSGFTKGAYPSTTFAGISYAFTAMTYNGGTGVGTVYQVTSVLSGTSYAEYENMVLAVIRSRGYVLDHINLPSTTVFDAKQLTITSNSTNIGIGDMFAQFTLTATNTGLTPTLTVSGSTELYTVSLNPDASSFMPNVLGVGAKDKKTKIWVQATYPQLIKKIDAEGYGYAINTRLIKCSTNLYTNYKTQFKTPETPWIVSQLMGNKVNRLFKFVSISDGDAANQEIKISLININPITMEFDVIVRAFYDTDAQPNILETYSKVNLIKGTNNYIGQAIGTTDGEYSIKSKYLMVEMADDDHQDSWPAGFEGLMFNDYAIAATGDVVAGIAPAIFYKTSYTTTERVARVYLGVSMSAYDAPGVVGDGLNQNFFNFDGYNNSSPQSSGFSKT